MTNKKTIFAVIAFISLLILFFAGKQYYEQSKEKAKYTIYYGHENLSKAYCEEIQKKFDACVATHDTDGLNFLSRQLDVRLKIEDFRIRSKEAEQTKFSTYISGTALVTLIVAVIGFFRRKNS